jgi:excinuclease ABC subunit B
MPPRKPGFAEAPQKALKTSRGTSMGGKGTARERAAAGLNPVPGIDMSLEEAEAFLATLKPEKAPDAPRRVRPMPPPLPDLAAEGVTATVQALSDLIESGRPEFRDKTWMPHRPPRPEKSEGGMRLPHQASDFEPKRRPADGDRRTRRRRRGARPRPGAARRHRLGQDLHGMAKVIEATQRPALILAPNKTLAAQLYGEFKSVLPGQCGGIFRLVLRLLPARSLRAAHRHLYREGFRRSTSRSTACATRRRARCSSATT